MQLFHRCERDGPLQIGVGSSHRRDSFEDFPGVCDDGGRVGGGSGGRGDTYAHGRGNDAGGGRETLRIAGETGTSDSLAVVLAEEKIANAGERRTLRRVSLAGTKARALLLG